MSSRPPTALLVAGDPSGDLHGAGLARALKALSPGLRVAAVGGARLRAEADEFLADLAGRGLTGFWEPALQAGALLSVARRLKEFLRARRPEILVCVDYWGFNRRVLSLARAAGVPAVYFISPQVWASRPGRVAVIRRLVRRMLVIFPFEEELYARAGVPVEFVGHPLLDLLPPPEEPALDPEAPNVGLLPGSRASELKRLLPVFYGAFRLLRRRRPGARGWLFAADSQGDAAYGRLPEGTALVRERDYRRRARLDLALCSSGTATLENALLGVPMVVAYRLSWPTYAVARALVRVRHISMANILAGRGLVPELIQSDATPERAARELEALLGDPARLRETRRELLALRASLGRPGAYGRAARAVLAEAARAREASP